MFKKTFIALLTATALFAGLSTAYAADTQVQFKKGQTAATYSGKIKGSEYDSYFFTAKQGQVLKVDLDTKAHAEVVLFGQDNFVAGDNYVLPQSGKYEVRVLQMRTFARRGAQSPYSLTITIENSGAKNTPAAQSPQSDSAIYKQRYSCKDNKVLEVVYMNAPDVNYAVINQGGEMIPMNIMPMASGANYASIDQHHAYKLYTKGNSAFLEQDDKPVLSDCVEE
ncbi:MliC family protein [Testudinibacter sp. P80/BLE/0925]|uniref:MliC family protein n=1 Tax=Testudinibacter sp. TW-1 TaxID=3417757 RepID=UPI003D35AE84